MSKTFTQHRDTETSKLTSSVILVKKNLKLKIQTFSNDRILETIFGYFASLCSPVLLRNERRLPINYNSRTHYGLRPFFNHTKSRVKHR